ncbi:Rhodanese- sulfurtransferase [Coemansia spiralis]|uniref:Ribosome biogenesis regulatory protein n=2 Tax=Coemansia TaxID=4863 RepID=A0A9W8KZE7_9FUNG|nr:ribosome biogenesis regulatory protein-domain-containing protein [Coemansia spiralis]KAJ1995212.1 Rhodanese- sulfurtransferase [Coemansia umbellata]KAJ2625614.1 Rhodanese- sulfurtransferase [Coemansia sp. RSA 1358]KAJ2678745.1 Rhodanese- sulfurtransferase [Coemansia spiralis]
MDVTGILDEHKSRFKSVQVDRLIPPEIDLGMLASFDINMINDAKLKANQNTRDTYLKELSREGAQLLINEIFSLPTTVDDDGIYASLPKATTVLPREKPVPKEKLLTRWEKFAKIKNIQKRKKSRMAFDEEQGEWRPRYGFKGINNDDQKPWLIEVPGNADPYADQYQARRQEKKERVEKNKRRQQRNAEEGVATEKGLKPQEMRKRELQKALVMSKGSTASLGKFDEKLKGEPKIKGLKRKFDPLVSTVDKEKSKNMDILNRVAKKESSATVLNVRKAQRAINNSKRKQK